jgi:hypothetical protein
VNSAYAAGWCLSDQPAQGMNSQKGIEDMIKFEVYFDYV